MAKRDKADDIIRGQMSLFELPLEAGPEIEAESVPEIVKALKPLTLAELTAMKPFSSDVVWIETRERFEVDVTNPVCRFYLLFPACFTWIGVPIGSERRHYHFKYQYTNGRSYEYKRVDEFYGREWRVWPEKPTEEQREAAKWDDACGEDHTGD